MMLLHDQTETQLKQLISSPTHAILLTGDEGSGKHTAALWLGATLLGKETLAEDSHFKHIMPIKNSLGIDQVRELQKFLQLKTTGTDTIRRIVIIEDGHTMTREAQNALLKVLEEPPTDTVLIITAVPSNDLLPTIYSRMQQLSIKPVNASRASEHFQSQGYQSTVIDRAYMMSNGRIGIMTALLEQNQEHSLANAIEIAKSALTKNTFERLIMVDELSKQRAQLPDLLQAFARVARAALEQSAKADKQTQIQHWHRILEKVHYAQGQLDRTPNTKLLLTDLMLSL